MKPMRPVSTIVLVGMCLGALPACTSVLLNTPVTKRAEGWVVKLSEVKDGPSEYVGEAVHFQPGSGNQLIWAVLTVRSEAPEEQTFSYDACTLSDGTLVTEPAVVARHPEVSVPVDRSEAFTNGQERTRLLVYRFPDERRPTRIKCGTIVLPIPAAR